MDLQVKDQPLKERIVNWLTEQYAKHKATYDKFEPVIKTLGGFNPAGKWMKVFVQGVKKKRGVQAGFGAKYKKKIQFVVGCVIIPTGFAAVTKFLNNLGKEKSQNLKYFRSTFLEFNLTEVPRMIPMHHFSFFDTLEI
jgi:hypothetical protein